MIRSFSSLFLVSMFAVSCVGRREYTIETVSERYNTVFPAAAENLTPKVIELQLKHLDDSDLLVLSKQQYAKLGAPPELLFPEARLVEINQVGIHFSFWKGIGDVCTVSIITKPDEFVKIMKERDVHVKITNEGFWIRYEKPI